MRTIFLLLSINVLSISRGTSQLIEKDTKKYFLSDAYNKCQEIWKKYRVSYENTIASALKGGFGHQTMNVYIKRSKDALLLSNGYYHSDNQVGILFQEVLLEEFPSFLNPEISFDLCGNALSIETTLSKVIIHTDYFLFRNKSDVIYALKDQDSFQSSPFRFQQVKNTGQMAITAEKCLLYGTVFTKLDGHTINLGIDTLKLRSCQFTVDVYTPGQNTPPVLASYLFHQDGPNQKNIMVQALSNELMPQLQAALFAHLNTAEVFDKELLYIEQNQKVIVAEVESYIDSVLRYTNMRTIENNMGTINMNNFDVQWTDAFDGTEKDCGIHLSNVKMSGLDSAYSAHIGGPYRIDGMPVKIAERVRMSNLQVLGVVTLRGMYEGEYNFSADIYDADIDMILDVDKLEERHKGNRNNDQKRLSNHKFILSGWSTLEFSCPDVEELPIEAIVTGYLLNELPEHVVGPLSNVYKKAVANYLGNENNIGSLFNQESTEQLNNGNSNQDYVTDEDGGLASEEDKQLVGQDYDKAATDESNIILLESQDDYAIQGPPIQKGPEDDFPLQGPEEDNFPSQEPPGPEENDFPLQGPPTQQGPEKDDIPLQGNDVQGNSSDIQLAEITDPKA